MKKIIALLLAMLLSFALCACGAENKDDASSTASRVDSSSSTRQDEDDDTVSEETIVTAQPEKLELRDPSTKQVICTIKDKNTPAVSNASELSGKKVAYILESDGSKIAKYYGAVMAFGSGSAQDIFSELNQENPPFDYIIFDEFSAKQDARIEVVCEVKIDQ